MKRLGLGIDAGGSGTGWQLVDTAGQVVASGRTGGLTGHLFRTDGELSSEGADSLARLRAVLTEAVTSGRPTAVVLGAAGLDSGSAAAGRLAGLIRQELQLAEDTVIVDNDMTIAYRSVFEPGEGVLVYGGTGSIAFHLPRRGPALRVGGHGYLIDDAGGGFWIGRQALSTVLRWQDELGLPSNRPLAQEVYRQLGTSDWPDIRTAVYGSGRSSVAALTPAVLRAADLGDSDAISILAAAGSELARLANVLLRRLGQILPVTLLGGVARLGSHVTDPLQEALPGMTRLAVGEQDPALAAALLAVRLRPAEE